MAAPAWESTLGEFIGARRRALGLSLEEVAAALDRSPSWVAAVEGGRHTVLPPPELFRRLADLLQVEPLEMLQVAGYLEPADASALVYRVVPMIERITDAFFALDLEWRFTYMNHQAASLFRRGRDDLIGRNLWEEFPRAAGSVFDREYRRALDTDTSVSFEAFYEPAGAWFEVHAYPSEEGLAVVLTNIDERKHREEERNLLLAREHDARKRAEAAAERTNRLQVVSAALSGALRPLEVARVVVEQGIVALGARAGAINLVSADGSRLEVAHASGYADPHLDPYRTFPVDAPTPAAESARTAQPVWIESGDDWDARYPHLVHLHRQIGFEAAMAIPLVVDARVLGQLSFSFDAPRNFEEDERAFALALAQQCAQALDRARLYAAEQQARAEAEEQRTRLHDLFMQAPALIVVTRGPDHVIELANPQFMRLVGDRDLIGKPSREGLPELVAQGYIAIDDQVYQSGETYVGIDMETRYDRDGDGTWEDGFFNFVIQPTRDAAGSVDGLMIHAFEVTEQVLARREIERLAAERAAILGQIADGIIIADTAGKITYVNPAGQRILGVSILGVPIYDHPDQYQALTVNGQPFPAEETPLARAIREQETTLDFPLRVRRPDGTEIVLETSATPLTGEGGERAGAVATFRDVTAQYNLARQKDDFLAAAAHDLRTPLTSIKGLAQLLRRRARRLDLPEMASLIEDLERIDATTGRMNMLINRLLDLTRLQMNQPLALDRSPTDLVAILRRLVDEQQHVSHRHHIMLDAGVPEIVGDWDGFRLERAFSNLLSNATKYSPTGGEVTITVRRVDEAGAPVAVVSVRDHGLGIPADALPHIFERFYRASNASDIPGVGIGLAGTQQIIGQHGGSIDVASEEGKGTTMTVRLPLAGDEEHAAHPDTGAADRP